MTVLNEFTFLNGVTAPCYSKELLNNAGGGLVLAVSDGFDGSITVQGKQNGEWYTLGVVDLAKAGAADAITAAGSYSVIGVAGFSHIRLNLTAVSGTATVSGRLTTEPGTILAASSSESGGGGGSGLPAVTSSDNGKMLQVDAGEWKVKQYPIITSESTTLYSGTVSLTSTDFPNGALIPLNSDISTADFKDWRITVDNNELEYDADNEEFTFLDTDSGISYIVTRGQDYNTISKIYLLVTSGGLPPTIVEANYSVSIIGNSNIIDSNFKLANEEATLYNVSFSYSNSTWSCDKTYAEVMVHLSSKIPTMAIIDDGTIIANAWMFIDGSSGAPMAIWTTLSSGTAVKHEGLLLTANGIIYYGNIAN